LILIPMFWSPLIWSCSILSFCFIIVWALSSNYSEIFISDIIKNLFLLKTLFKPENRVKFSGSIWFSLLKIQYCLVHLKEMDISRPFLYKSCFKNVIKKSFYYNQLWKIKQKVFFCLITFEDDFPTSTIDSWSWRTLFQVINFELIVQIKSYFQYSSIISRFTNQHALFYENFIWFNESSIEYDTSMILIEKPYVQEHFLLWGDNNKYVNLFITIIVSCKIEHL
jgi:hypothetical protein